MFEYRNKHSAGGGGCALGIRTVSKALMTQSNPNWHLPDPTFLE